jgi:hypothetical protein
MVVAFCCFHLNYHAQGFLDIRMKKWLRNLMTRCIAIAPSLVVSIIGGSSGAGRLIIIASVRYYSHHIFTYPTTSQLIASGLSTILFMHIWLNLASCGGLKGSLSLFARLSLSADTSSHDLSTKHHKKGTNILPIFI